jgi:hypothetical protein
VVDSSIALAIAVDETELALVLVLNTSTSSALELYLPIAHIGPAVACFCVLFGHRHSVLLDFLDEVVEVVFVVFHVEMASNELHLLVNSLPGEGGSDENILENTLGRDGDSWNRREGGFALHCYDDLIFIEEPTHCNHRRRSQPMDSTHRD